MKKLEFVLLCAVLEALLISCVALANANPDSALYFVFYNLGYGLIF